MVGYQCKKKDSGLTRNANCQFAAQSNRLRYEIRPLLEKEVAREGYLRRVASIVSLEVEFQTDLNDPRVVAEDQTRLIEEV